MATHIVYHLGGFNPAAPAQNRAERWDPATGYTAWDAQGAVTTQRALTADEAALLAADDTATTDQVNADTVDANLNSLIASLQADVSQDNQIIAGANPIIASTGTLSSATLSANVRSLATAVKALANNDINNKKALQNLLHKIQDNYTDLTGT